MAPVQTDDHWVSESVCCATISPTSLSDVFAGNNAAMPEDAIDTVDVKEVSAVIDAACIGELLTFRRI
jgi:hypothetical protein